VSAFGTRHTFDMAARDGVSTMALEVKMVKVDGGSMPNGEIQRFLGQCSLAAIKHDVVIGVCGYRGEFNPRHETNTTVAAKWFRDRGVRLVFKRIA
jgi:hypothetical protein